MRTALLISVLLAAPALASPGKDVDLKAADGTLLKATYFAAGKPGPGVILLHQCNGERKSWSGLAPLLVARGIHVLTLDYRGYGESGGPKYGEWTPEQRRKYVEETWPGDIDKAFDFLVAQPGVDRTRIGAGGASCGVNNSVQLARRHPEQVKALVFLSGQTTQPGQEFLAGASWIPILAAAARDDRDAVAGTRWAMNFSSNPLNQFKEYPNGGHGTTMFAAQKELEPLIAAWFERHLITHPVVAARGPGKPGPSAEITARLRAGEKVENPPQDVVNALGYQAMRQGRLDEAIRLFTLNAEAHPESANAFDSLSEAYLAANQRDKAVAAAKKALSLLPGDKTLDDELKQEIRAASEKTIRGE